MKQYYRNKIGSASSYLEIIISALIILGTALSCVILLMHIVDIVQAYNSIGLAQQTFDSFLAFAIQLIIAVEFVKMLSKHTPGSTIEVLLVAIAKRVIVDKLTMLEILLGVIAIVLLFLVKKHLLSGNIGKSYSGETLYDASITVNEFNKLTGSNIPLTLGPTLEDVIVGEFTRTSRKIRLHETLTVDRIQFTINEMRDGRIRKLEIVTVDGDE